MTPAAIYCRISSDREGDGLGVERQRADCEALAKRLGWTVAATYIDDDRSAYSGKPRPAYRQLLEAIDAGTVSAVLAWHPDRLHRSPRELEGFIDLVERHGTAVQTCTAGLVDLSTPTGRMQARIVGSVARFESEHKSERLRRKMDELAAAGQPHAGGYRAFGYRRILGPDGHPGRPVAYEIVPHEATLIREAADAILDEGRSLRSIALDWQARGVVSPTGKSWQPGPIRKMLCSAQLAGLRERHVDRDPKLRGARRGETALSDVNVPAILPRGRWSALSAILSDPARRTSPSNVRRNLLVGFLLCGRCGARMAGRPRSDGVRRYVCREREMGGCGGIAILAEPLEAEVLGRIFAALDSPAMREALVKMAGWNEAAPDPLGERAETEARMAEMAGDYAAGSITRAEWQSARGRLAERLAALAPVTVRPSVRLPADVAGAWADLDLEGRRRIVAFAVESITIGVATGQRNVFDPDRVAIKWRA
ncbi:MAG: recombinase family protein [Candidatus Limnocylindrales bacterium]